MFTAHVFNRHTDPSPLIALPENPFTAMAANNGTIILPNPYTPLAFIPPELATSFINKIYASVGTLAVCSIRFQHRFKS
jgi:hypothetical protein